METIIHDVKSIKISESEFTKKNKCEFHFQKIKINTETGEELEISVFSNKKIKIINGGIM